MTVIRVTFGMEVIAQAVIQIVKRDLDRPLGVPTVMRMLMWTMVVAYVLLDIPQILV